ncbi:MAG TPA: BON domain-containing protein [Chloroflexota bacterium]|nr:BON domain-containing protein [Chloroflexota bacterium]
MNYGYGPGMPRSYGTQNFAQAGFGGYGTAPYAGGFGLGAATDDEICYFVEQSLDNDPTIPTHVDIGVDVNNGVVTLTGTVPNKRIKHAAGDDAWWLPQVFDVHNEINVVSRKERAGTGEKGTGTTSGRQSRSASR